MTPHNDTKAAPVEDIYNLHPPSFIVASALAIGGALDFVYLFITGKYILHPLIDIVLLVVGLGMLNVMRVGAKEIKHV